MGDRYDRIRSYAAGKQDIEKYKRLLNGDKNANQVSIHWRIPFVVDKFIAKINKKYFQVMKNYKMVERLKSLVWQIPQYK